MLTRIRRRVGFTLIELLVVIAIIAILIALLVPAVQRVRNAAARTQCMNNLKQITLALQDFHGAWKAFPVSTYYTDPNQPGYESDNYVAPWDEYYGGWMCCILPYIEQGNVWKELPTTVTACTTPIACYLCPSDWRSTATFTGWGSSEQYAMTDYVGISGWDYDWYNPPSTSPTSKQGILGVNSNYVPQVVTINQITDGTSNTIIVAERPFSVAVQTPGDPYPDPYYWGWWSYPSGIDNISGARNSSPFYPANQFGGACANGPMIYGTGPNDLNNPCSFNYLWSAHENGSNMAFADGTVRFITYGAGDLVSNLSTYAGAEGATDMDDY